MRKMWTGLILLLFVCSAQNTVAQKKDESLLWRISGNGLKEPSYLFGTIHIKDQRVFNFSDSLYYYLDKVDAFALEVHPDSVIASAMSTTDASIKKKLIKDRLTKSEFDKLSKKLKTELGVDANKLSERDAYFIKQRLSLPKPQKEDMSTFVDLYLYDVANQKNKILFGLEKADDQIKLFDDLRKDFDVKELLKDNTWEKAVVESMIDVYVKEDINKLTEMVSQSLSDSLEDRMMVKRNYVMLNSIDSIARFHSLFAAVGAAHLPGRYGLISLLRSKGYEVVPVLTVGRTHATKMKFENEKRWLEVVDSTEGYFVEMPGKPMAQQMLNQTMNLNMYYDISKMQLYYVGHMVSPRLISSENKDSVLNAMIDGSIANSKGREIKRSDLTISTGFGKEVLLTIPKGDMFGRMRVMSWGKDVYMVFYSSQKEEDLENASTHRYLNSFKPLPRNTRAAWKSLTSPEHAFTLKYPGRLNTNTETGQETGYTEFSMVDASTGNYYGAVATVTRPNRLYTNDSIYLESNYQSILNGLDTSAAVIVRDTMVQGYKAKWIAGAIQGIPVYYLNVVRNSRAYSFLALSGNEFDSDLQQFFASIKLSPYNSVNWSRQSSLNKDFSTWAPRFFEKEPTDSNSTTIDRINFSFDQGSGNSFYVDKHPLTRYQWIHSDTSYLRSVLEYNAVGNRIDNIRFTYKDNIPAINATIHFSHSIAAKKIKILRQGDSLFLVWAYLSPQETNNDTDKFFEEFSLTAKNDFSFKDNSFEKLLKDLHSKDSILVDSARNGLQGAYYHANDFETLCAAAIKKYDEDSTQYYTINEIMFEQAEKIVKPEHYDFLAGFYKTLGKEQEAYKFDVLSLLLKTGHENAVETAVSFFNQQVPQNDNPYEFFRLLESRHHLTRNYIPAMMKHLADTMVRKNILGMVSEFLDSSYVTPQSLMPFKPLLLETTRQLYTRSVKLHDENEYYFDDLFNVLTKLVPDSVETILNRFAKVRNSYCRWTVFERLLKSNARILGFLLDSIAADKSYVVSLYSTLKEEKKLKLFPARFLTQQHFALGYLQDSFDEEEPQKIIPVGNRVKKFKGKNYRFYLFKVVSPFEEGEHYLGISGPFMLDSKIVEVNSYYSGIHYDEEFSQKNIDRLLKDYLDGMEKPEVPEDEEGD